MGDKGDIKYKYPTRREPYESTVREEYLTGRVPYGKSTIREEYLTRRVPYEKSTLGQSPYKPKTQNFQQVFWHLATDLLSAS